MCCLCQIGAASDDSDGGSLLCMGFGSIAGPIRRIEKERIILHRNDQMPRSFYAPQPLSFKRLSLWPGYSLITMHPAAAVDA